MKLTLDGITFHLGRRRKDGRRNVERVRLASWRSLLPKLFQRHPYRPHLVQVLLRIDPASA